MKTTLQTQVDRLAGFIRDAKFMEAIDDLYDTNVVIHENEDAGREGSDILRKGTKEFMANFSNYSAELKSVIVSDDISTMLWHYKFDMNGMGRIDTDQISVQRWKDGRIIHERHHYKSDKW